MPIFKGQCPPNFTSCMLNLNSITSMLYCIAQNDSSTRELDAFTLLGVSNILETAGNEIKQAYDELLDKYEAHDKLISEYKVVIKRYRKMLVELSVYVECNGLSGDSELARILADGSEVGK